MAERTVVSRHIHAKLKVTFRPEIAAKYKEKGVPLDQNNSVTFHGTFTPIQDSKPFFRLQATKDVCMFGESCCAYIRLNWSKEDLISIQDVGFSHEPIDLWRPEWSDEEILEKAS